MERAIEDVQIALRRYDEHLIWLEDQSFRDELHRHFGVAREDFLEMGGYKPQMIDNHHCGADIGRQVPKQLDVGVQAPRRTAYANDRNVVLRLADGLKPI